MPSAAQNFPEITKLKNDKGINLNISQCSKCGVVQTTNRPVNYYREVIRAPSFSPEMIKFRTVQFKKIIQRYKLRGKKIIEVGSGYGEYLSLLNNFELKAFRLRKFKQSNKNF